MNDEYFYIILAIITAICYYAYTTLFIYWNSVNFQ